MTNLEKFEFFTQDLESPDHFIRFNFYFLISSCLERRVWIGPIERRLYPNLYLIFVARPGFGKTMPAKAGEDILRSLVYIKDGAEAHVINTAPDTVSFEKLLIVLASDSVVKSIPYEGDNLKRLYTHSSVSFCLADEIGTLIRDHTTDVITFLNKGWDCSSHKVDTVKHGPKVISNMCINLLGCCTPAWLGRQLDNNNLHEGFSARVIFINGDKPRKRTTLFQITEAQRYAVNELRKHLILLTKIKPVSDGIVFNPHDTPEAFEWFDNWVQTKMDKHLNDSKHMEHYYGRKKAHLMKLAMAIHFSESLEMKLELKDLQTALKELEMNEVNMDQALSMSTKNPLFSLSEGIKQALKYNGPTSAKRILIDFYDAGNEEAIDKALSFLVNTDQIHSFMEKNVLKYTLTHRTISKISKKDDKSPEDKIIEDVLSELDEPIKQSI